MNPEIDEEEKSTDYEEAKIVVEKESADYDIYRELNEKEILTVSRKEPVNEKVEEPEIINTRGHYSSAGSNNNAQVKYELPEDVGDYKENDLVDDGHNDNAVDDPDDEDYIPIKEFQRVKKREYDG